METVPPVVAGKDLMYLEDMLTWNLTLSKKATHYSTLVSDPYIKETMEALANAAKTHYQALLNAFNIGGTNE